MSGFKYILSTLSAATLAAIMATLKNPHCQFMFLLVNSEMSTFCTSRFNFKLLKHTNILNLNYWHPMQ